MEVIEKNEGYVQKIFKMPVKRYCQTLDLKEDTELIEEYKKYHSEEFSWTEIRTQIQSVGILEMEIYIIDSRLFMIVETPLDFEWEEAFLKLSKMPLQQEWEKFVSRFQVANSEDSSTQKWKLMDRIFYLY